MQIGVFQVGNTLSFLVMVQPHNRHISCCVYMAALAVSDNAVVLVTATLVYPYDGTIDYKLADCLTVCYLNAVGSGFLHYCN